ncbi:T9SS type A sorting domain-containing protein [Sporocytophaga myxococcoides]|uniref:T9SS type A sorting domain-containing protein n=1 Tax=Sporocytophaga myxococcoides TaxID=153721 RepID=UPI0004297B4D|nr:T9SS type A sorting domain-containing protein [Sporocytophaga myxococcoides]
MLKLTKKAVTLSLLLSLGIIGVKAQSSTVSAGGEGSGSGGTVSYSIGLTSFEASSGTSGSVSTGVQHAYVSVVSGVDHPEINLLAEVYPNPTANTVTLKVDGISTDNLSFVLLDINGNVLEQSQLNSNSTTINLENLSNTTFLLKVFRKKQVLKTFKIIKNS